AAAGAVDSAGDRLPDRLLAVQRGARLIDISKLDALAELQAAAVGLLLPGQDPEERRLARAVRPDDADDAAGRQAERQVLEQQLLAERLLQPLGFDHQVAEVRPWRNVDLVGLVALLHVGGLELLEAREARLALRAPSLGIGAHPLELLLHRLDSPRLLLRLDLQALLLLLEPAGVV